MPGWKSLEQKIPTSKTEKCGIHGQVEHYLMTPYHYFCSDCLQEILAQIVGSVGGETLRIFQKKGLYKVEGMSVDTLIELRKEYVYEKVALAGQNPNQENHFSPEEPVINQEQFNVLVRRFDRLEALMLSIVEQPPKTPLPKVSPEVVIPTLICKTCQEPMILNKTDGFAYCQNPECHFFDIPIPV